VGWLLLYGDKRQHATAVLWDEGRADQLAANLRAIKHPLIVGTYLDDVTKDAPDDRE
jgi:hypothetical protein